MEPIVLPELENYAAAHTEPESELLQELIRETKAKTEIPQMAVGHLEGAFLKMLIRISDAKRVLEVGTFTGYSSLAMAEGLPADGELITCDINPETTAMAKEYWSRSPGGKKIQSVMGPALESIAKLEGQFDFVFIDADKMNYLAYWEACLPKVNSGGLLAVDNVLWSGTVLSPKDDDEIAIAAFNDHVLRDARVEVVMVTIRDGITLARKK